MQSPRIVSFLKLKILMDKYILSICIPSYNRPNELLRLLKSIPKSTYKDIEVVICEDYSPKRKEISRVVGDFDFLKPDLKIRYFENETNLGYDLNLKELIKRLMANLSCIWAMMTPLRAKMFLII